MMTLGSVVDIEDLSSLPTNFYWSKLAPATLLASLADVVICYGGNGTVYQALETGTPLITLPKGGEQFWNARRHTELGVNLTPTSMDKGSLRDAVSEVVSNPSYKENAEQLQALIGENDGPHLASQLINELFEEKIYA